ncbi:unnamed protein product [Hymenolepis diminuta]|uniref:Reverse transcriptase domain-containing protein n=1 Tax=Hymenolepis diminuta TaxID=6216 RepID=A0A0R3SQC2_HYMDI|nr:unnamed protein product [Hymenolepis diminuta]
MILSGTDTYSDDVIFLGHSQQELRERVIALLQRIPERGVRLRAEKCTFLVPSFKYLRCIFDENGRRPDKYRNATAYGHYHTSFFPTFPHNIRAPLNELLKKAKLNWTSKCEKAFTKLKDNSDMLLSHYNRNL